jgi:hypothetical protein
MLLFLLYLFSDAQFLLTADSWLNRLLAKLQEVICLEEASFSATAASVALWALLKVRFK